MTFTDIAIAALTVIGIALMTALAVVPFLLDHDAEKRTARVMTLRPGAPRGHTAIGARQRAA